MPNIFGMIMALFMLAGQGHTDLVGLLPTDEYWKAKGVAVDAASMEAQISPKAQGAVGPDALAQALKDMQGDDVNAKTAARKIIQAAGGLALEPLKAARAAASDPDVIADLTRLIDRLSRVTQDGAIRRLMAIRTLGERKEKGSLALLKTLADSKEPFVAEYALRAMAAINGEKLPPEFSAKYMPGGEDRLQAELNLLPENCAAVGQFHAVDGGGATLKSIVARPTDEQLKLLGVTREALMDQGLKGLMDMAERVGNVRIDALTAGISDDFLTVAEGTREHGWIVFVASGEFDRTALAQGLGQVLGGIPHEEVAGTTTLRTSNSSTLLALVGNQRMVLTIAPQQTASNAIMQAMLAAIQGGGKGGFEKNTALQPLIKAVDPGATLWAVSKNTPTFQQFPLFIGVDTLVATASMKDGNISYAFKGHGPDGAKLTAVADMINQELAQGMGRSTGADMPPQYQEQMKLSLAFLKAIKCQASGNDISLTGDVQGPTIETYLGMMFRSLTNR